MPMRVLLVVMLVAVAWLAGCATIRPPDGLGVVERPMVVTGYCKCGQCCGWERNWFGRAVFSSGPKKGKRKLVGQTARGTMARHGTIAADPARYPFGTVMYISGYGYRRVEDTGSGVRGDHIDLYFHSHGAALDWGKQRKVVRIWLPGSALARSGESSVDHP